MSTPKPSKLFTARCDSSFTRVGAFDRQIGHVVRLVEEHAGPLPRLLLVAPVRELRRHSGIHVRARLRVPQQLDRALRGREHVLETPMAHLQPPLSGSVSIWALFAEVARDEQLAVRAQLRRVVVQDDLAVREHVAAVGDLEREVHVLLDEQHGAAALVRELRARPAAAARRSPARARGSARRAAAGCGCRASARADREHLLLAAGEQPGAPALRARAASGSTRTRAPRRAARRGGRARKCSATVRP